MAGQGSSLPSTALTKQTLQASGASKDAANSGEPSPNHDATTKLSSHFNQSQLALALTIQKSRPSDLSTTEYCRQLRKHIKGGRKIAENDGRYVDTCEFWKDQYMKIHLEKKVLEDRAHCLEEKERLLRQRIVQDSSSNESQSQLGQVAAQLDRNPLSCVSRKRPAPTDDVEIWLENQQAILSLPADDILLKLSSYILRIGRQRTNLEGATKVTSNLTEIDDLAKACIQTLTLLENTLSDCCIPVQLLKANDDNPQKLVIFQQVLNQVGLAYKSCFKALNELCRTIPGRSKKAVIIYQMIMFFNKALNLLHRVSTLQFEEEVLKENRRLRSARPKTQQVDQVEYAVSIFLAKTLAAVVYSLEWDVHQPAHSDLLEGIFFFIIEHTGRLVSEAVFAEHVASSKNPGNITELNGIPESNVIGRFESRYMLQVLYAALGGADRKEQVAQVLARERTNFNIQKRLEGSTGVSVLKGDLLTRAKLLIQSTLVKSAIGGEGLETLKSPEAPTEDMSFLGEEAVGVEYGSDWLIGTVWALIGWDLVV